MIVRSVGDDDAPSTGAPGSYDIRVQDCVEFLRDLPDESVDLIVTDPAYSGMNQHMRFGHGRIVGNYGKPDNHRWFQEFSDDPESYAVFLRECHRVLRRTGTSTSCSTASRCSRSARSCATSST